MKSLSYRAYGMICAALLCIVIATMACVGCAAPRVTQEYGVDTFTIRVADRATIQKEWDKHEAHKREQMRGFYDEMTRTVWVQPSGTTTNFLPYPVATNSMYSIRLDVFPGGQSYTIFTNGVYFTTNEVMGANATDIKFHSGTTTLLFDKPWGTNCWRCFGL